MELGLKRGTVALQPHQVMWEENAVETIRELKEILRDTAVDIQHIGSTSIRGISAKPIIDLVIGVRDLEDIKMKIDDLEKAGVVFRGQDHPEQLLFVKGDFEKDTRTHHIHVAVWGGESWVNYMNFRDYLNTFSEKAAQYDALKNDLLSRFAEDRGRYTSGKQELIDTFLEEARIWRAE